MKLYRPPIGIPSDPATLERRCEESPHFWALTTPLAKSAGERLILLALAAASSTSEWTSTTSERLAGDLGLDPAKVSAALRNLEERHAIIPTSKWQSQDVPGFFILWSWNTRGVLPWPIGRDGSETIADGIALFEKWTAGSQFSSVIVEMYKEGLANRR